MDGCSLGRNCPYPENRKTPAEPKATLRPIFSRRSDSVAGASEDSANAGCPAAAESGREPIIPRLGHANEPTAADPHTQRQASGLRVARGRAEQIQPIALCMGCGEPVAPSGSRRAPRSAYAPGNAARSLRPSPRRVCDLPLEQPVLFFQLADFDQSNPCLKGKTSLARGHPVLQLGRKRRRV